MASITKESGRRIIQFVAADLKRRSVRLGKCEQRTAEGVRLHVERLIESQTTGMPLHGDTSGWLAGIGDDLHDRLVRAKLTQPRTDLSRRGILLGAMLDKYITRRLADMKPWSVKMLRQCKDKLVGFFGEDKPVALITAADAMDFKRSLATKHSVAYVAKLVLLSRQFFRDAVDSEILAKSPFAKVKAGSQRNPDRQRFVDSATIARAIEHAPDIEWKLLIALARYGGLRVPSEPLAMRWADVLWDQGKILVRASKTEHYLGKGIRYIPLFPELRKYLLEAFGKAEEGAEYVITRHRNPAANFRTHFLRILGRAGIKPWPKLFQNLRSSRQTELTETWPAHVVCAWLGNSEVVARNHYLQITEEHFASAARGEPDSGGAEAGAAPAGFAPQGIAPPRGEKDVSPAIARTSDMVPNVAKSCIDNGLGATGTEHPNIPRENPPIDLSNGVVANYSTRFSDPDFALAKAHKCISVGDTYGSISIRAA